MSVRNLIGEHFDEVIRITLAGVGPQGLIKMRSAKQGPPPPAP